MLCLPTRKMENATMTNSTIGVDERAVGDDRAGFAGFFQHRHGFNR